MQLKQYSCVHNLGKDNQSLADCAVKARRTIDHTTNSAFSLSHEFTGRTDLCNHKENMLAVGW